MEKKRPGLPDNAKLVFKGVIFEVWQWEQKMFDGSTATFEKVWRPATVEVIATREGKIIIEEEDQPDRLGNIGIVSGRADQGEDMLEEAKRELLEETGCVSDDWEPLLTIGKKGKVIHEVQYFIARDCKKVAEPMLEPGERIETKLVSFEEFLDLVQDLRFWNAPEFVLYIDRIRSDEKKKEEFRNLLFPR